MWQANAKDYRNTPLQQNGWTFTKNAWLMASIDIADKTSRHAIFEPQTLFYMIFRCIEIISLIIIRTKPFAALDHSNDDSYFCIFFIHRVPIISFLSDICSTVSQSLAHPNFFLESDVWPIKSVTFEWFFL